MKKNIGIKKIAGILLISLLIITTDVYAANDSFETTLKASSSQLKAEDNVTITIGLNNITIESGEKGIGAYTGSIKFDSSVLEYVSTNGTDKWEAPVYENGLIVGNTKDGNVVNTAQNIGTITFKVKKDAKIGETTITLENFSGSTAETDVETSNKSIKIEIVKDNTGNDNDDNTNNNVGNDNDNNNTNNNVGSNDNNNSTNNNTGSNNNNNNTGNNNINKNENTNNKKDKLPYAGNNNITTIIVIGVCTLLAIFFYTRIKAVNKNC
ncbi:MAG: hypothetical protein HFJ60_06225 [Clostridia bacterium]|jgi:hypothetical protein|nr:hypothetical protein [Clostridia bacterium]